MSNIIYDIIFLLISLYILLKAIGYGIYELKEKENKTGGTTVIVFSILVVIFSNIMIFLRWFQNLFVLIIYLHLLP